MEQGEVVYPPWQKYPGPSRSVRDYVSDTCILRAFRRIHEGHFEQGHFCSSGLRGILSKYHQSVAKGHRHS
eukprot:scaffold7340_cov108-Skeletonema_menzelii.AAC.2